MTCDGVGALRSLTAAFYPLTIIHEPRVQRTTMKPTRLLMECVALLLMCGCDLPPSGPVDVRSRPVTESKPASRGDNDLRHSERSAGHSERTAEVSFDTARDERFAEFAGKAAGGMVRKIAVGIDRRGIMRVELGENTAPEDTLPLTKSLMAGARKDFPGKPITLKVFDPDGHAVLTAHYHPEHGIRYEVAGSDKSDRQPTSPDLSHSNDRAPDAAHWKSANAWSGSTNSDRQFAEWAFGKGHNYLRYVQADLERNGRLWFGVTSDVKPDDVAALTKSILEGARTEFPRRALTAKVFDPEGEPIGNASLGADGQIHWTHVASSK